MCQPRIEGHTLDCCCGEDLEVCVCGGDGAAGCKQELHASYCAARDRWSDRQAEAIDRYGQELVGLFEMAQEFMPEAVVPGPEAPGEGAVEVVDRDAVDLWFGMYSGWTEHELCDGEISSGHIEVVSWTSLDGEKWGFRQGI